MPSLPSGSRSRRRGAEREGGERGGTTAPPKGTTLLLVGILLGATVMGGVAAGTGPADVPEPVGNPFAGNAAAAAEGERLFKQFCGPCHGFDGRGGQGPNLTDEHWLHGGSDLEIYRIIASGVPGTRMREFGSLLNPEELWKIITFVRSGAGPAAR